MATKPKVLLIEDDPTQSQLYKEAFDHADFEVLEADDGEYGVDLAIQHQAAALILDLMLPRQGGLHVLRILRSMPETRTMPVIILTALPNPEYREMAKDMVQGYFLKTQVKPKELVDAVRALIDESA